MDEETKNAGEIFPIILIRDEEALEMHSYESFARIYDKLMYDVDYDKWADYLKNIISSMGIQCRSILDLACGTGNITIPLSRHGYNMWGVDISEQMLTVAENKSRIQGQNIKFLKQDMRYLNIGKKFDAAICACDGINYIIEEKDLIRTFHGVYRLLNDCGLFVFDISSYHKLKNIIGNNIFIEEKDDIFYVWENDFDEESSIVSMKLNFFVQEGELYNRIEESHIQKAHKIQDICTNLSQCGFDVIEILDEFSFVKAHEESERIFFVARKM